MALRKIQGFSLQPVELAAVKLLADETEDGNKSRFVTRLVRAAAEKRFGEDWRRVVIEKAQGQEVAA